MIPLARIAKIEDITSPLTLYNEDIRTYTLHKPDTCAALHSNPPVEKVKRSHRDAAENESPGRKEAAIRDTTGPHKYIHR